MEEREGGHSRSVRLVPATAIVVGNMVGTGVFVSLGFQLLGIQSPFVIMVLWGLGGLCALCGALCYGELAAALPRSGGEYHLLSEIYHPAVGFLAGWISVTVGFAAPIALAAMAFGRYFAGVAGWEGEWAATVLSVAVVLAVTGVHLRHISVGSRFQSVFTGMKVILILIFILASFLLGDSQGVSFLPKPDDWDLLWGPSFAVSLVFVMYAYTGWNAATYIVDEVREPRKTVPRALLIGTLVVMVLYLGLNAGFLFSTPMADMTGKAEVGLVAAKSVFGDTGGRVMASLICFGLISALSAMTWAGPRVAQRMGQDFRILHVLAKTSGSGIPHYAILWQTSLVLVLIFTSSFEQVLVYIELLLVLFGLLTVGGLYWLRIRRPDLERPVKTWGYPVTPLLFLGVSLWMMVYLVRERPAESLWGLGTLMAGLVVFFLAARGKMQPS